ncbi:MAG: UDP-N-acetyl-D-mannosamine dehydrogenase [Chloroflexi bacterium RBG_16_51_16]|nr:MAG: UDP-N-acetyl-D-mannosamine dehydrogenase [Chloroflexi bacterium RBG_16_51_16]
MNFKKICVLGLGYIGLPTASTFAANGLEVLGVDVNPKIIDTLRNGGIHIQEPGLRTVVESAIRSGNLTVAAIPEMADAFLIAVPTPFLEAEFGEFSGHKYKRADMRAVTAAAEAILPCLRSGNLVVLESTSPPRTTLDLVAPILERSGMKAGKDFYLCYSPERVLPGQIMRELIENTRVIGGVNPASAQAGRDLYALFVKGEIIETDATTAEMVKLMENTFRDINIATANEFSRLAEKFGVDVWKAIELANRHPRVNILDPGPGVGGHCISVDPWFLVEAAPEITPLIYQARMVNDGQPEFVLQKIRQALGVQLAGKRIAALGLAYKPDVDDMRESPAVRVVQKLKNEGMEVFCWEPFKPDQLINGIKVSPSLESVLKEAEALLLLVNHTAFRALDPGQVSKMTPARIVIDTVNGWDPLQWNKAGFKVFRLGDHQQSSI